MDVVVCIKQVPETTEVKINPETGTLMREGVPAIVNPFDLYALEEGLRLREKYGGSVTVITMGPPQAKEALLETISMGADEAILVSDRAFAGADTLATSYTLAQTIRRKGAFDLIICGKQAIDGDTAQVGPQIAEKLGIPQITYAEAITSLEGDEIVVERAFPLGREWVKCKLPCLLTVVGSANRPRPPSARKRIERKMAATPLEYRTLLTKWPEFESEDKLDAYLTEHDLKIPVWTADDLGADLDKLGLAGSPTQVYKVNFVVLETTESKEIPANQDGINALIQELVKEYIVG